MSFLFEELTREECEDIREQDGYVRGKEEGKIEIAKSMKSKGLDISLISEITGLTPEEIEKL